jgi:hypothetical protein
LALVTACGADDGGALATETASTGGSLDGDTSSASSSTTVGPRTTGIDGSSGPAASTGSGTSATEATTAADCDAPPLDPAWLVDYQTAIVAQLSGAAEISPGVTLPDRATPGRRDATRARLLDALDELGLAASVQDYGEGANVWAAIPATEAGGPASEETLVFGAHFDTVPGSPGANDNATGVAVALSLARWLGDAPCRRRNVIVVFLDQEEIGLIGSAAFAAFLVQQALHVVAVHTIDQMGWDADGDRAVELERPDPGLLEVYEASAAGLTPAVPLTATQTGATDHVSFRAAGFDAVGLTEEFVSGDTTPHYHAPTDTFETVNFAYLQSTTVLVHATFAELVVAG